MAALALALPLPAPGLPSLPAITALPAIAAGLAAPLSRHLLAAALQGSLFVLAVWLLCRLAPRLSASLRCTLWWLASLKLVLGLVWPAPLSLRLPVLPAASAVRADTAAGPIRSAALGTGPGRPAAGALAPPARATMAGSMVPGARGPAGNAGDAGAPGAGGGAAGRQGGTGGDAGLPGDDAAPRLRTRLRGVHGPGGGAGAGATALRMGTERQTPFARRAGSGSSAPGAGAAVPGAGSSAPGAAARRLLAAAADAAGEHALPLLPPLLVGLWLAGLLLQAAAMAGEWRLLRRILRQAQPVRDVALDRLAAGLCRALGLSQVELRLVAGEVDDPPTASHLENATPLRAADVGAARGEEGRGGLVHGCGAPAGPRGAGRPLRRQRQRRLHGPRAPFTAGALHPVVVLPAGAPERLTPEELAMTLCHELLHVRRRDLAWGWVPAIAARLFFFLPPAGLAAREYALAREAACDAAVLRLLGAAPAAYGRLLLRLGVSAPRHRAGLPGGMWPATATVVGATASLQQLKRRLEMLQHSPDAPGARSRPGRLSLAGIGLVALLAAATLVPLRLVAAAPDPAAADASAPVVATVPAAPATAATPRMHATQAARAMRATPATPALAGTPATPVLAPAAPAPAPVPAAPAPALVPPTAGRAPVPTAAPRAAVPVVAAAPRAAAAPAALVAPAGAAAPVTAPAPPAAATPTATPALSAVAPRLAAGPVPAPVAAAPRLAAALPAPRLLLSSSVRGGGPGAGAPPPPEADEPGGETRDLEAPESPEPPEAPEPPAPPAARRHQAPGYAPPPPPPAPPAPAAPPAPPSREDDDAVPPVPPTPPVPPAPPAPPRGGSHTERRHTATYSYAYRFSTDDNGDRYVLLRGDTRSVTMSGDTGDLDHARKLRGKGTGDFLWLRHDGKEYVIRDAATLKAVEDLGRPQEQLGERQGKLGDEQGALGDRQGALGDKQGALGERQGELGERLGKIAEEEARLATERNGDASGRLAQLRAERDKLSAEIRALGEQQRALGEQQRKLGAEQRELGRRQEALGREQERAGREAREKMRALIQQAIAGGAAQPVK